MKTNPPLIAAAFVLSGLMLGGCASEGDLIDDAESRQPPAEPMALTIEGHGRFMGRAEYEVSEPAGDVVPDVELVLSAQRVDTGESVTMRLGQSVPGEVAEHYRFPANSNGFYVTLDGRQYEGHFGEVELDAVDGRLRGDFELDSLEVDEKGEMGGDGVMLRGMFSIDEVLLNCNRLVDDKGGSAGSPGRAGDGAGLTWTPDAHLESAFCSAMKSRLEDLPPR